jgi:hypothetical protein
MVGLWDWFKGRGRANAKPVADDPGNAPAAPRKPKPRSTKKAVDRAGDDWAKNGDRADQDYYHVPGAGNPDPTDPPKLKGETLGKPRKAARPRSRKDA